MGLVLGWWGPSAGCYASQLLQEFAAKKWPICPFPADWLPKNSSTKKSLFKKNDFAKDKRQNLFSKPQLFLEQTWKKNNK